MAPRVEDELTSDASPSPRDLQPPAMRHMPSLLSEPATSHEATELPLGTCMQAGAWQHPPRGPSPLSLPAKLGSSPSSDLKGRLEEHARMLSFAFAQTQQIQSVLHELQQQREQRAAQADRSKPIEVE